MTAALSIEGQVVVELWNALSYGTYIANISSLYLYEFNVLRADQDSIAEQIQQKIQRKSCLQSA